MSIVQQRQRQRQQQRRRGMYFLLIVVSYTELLSLIPSTDGFATATAFSTWQHDTSILLSTQHQTKRPRTSQHTRLLNTKDDNDEPSCVLKERNPYDVHVYYNGPDERNAAMELRQKMEDEFGDWMRFYNPKDRPIGPHPRPMWEADFGGYEHRHKLSEVRDFLLQHNNSENEKPLSILIHPHSVDGDYADHTKHAFWAGEVLELRIQGWRR
jgi:aromatic ring-cleaving dioxygenase